MSQVVENLDLPQAIRLKHRAELLVIGGGPGGIGAAVAAAREGRDVLLVEHYGYLGGMATAGEVHPFMQNHLDGRWLDEGVFTDWVGWIDRLGGLQDDGRGFNPYVARLAAEALCAEAGVRLLYHHRVVHAQREGDRVGAVALHSKSGLTAARADVYIDSTGDGDLAALAGCPFEIGGPDGHCQPMTLCFKLRLDSAVMARHGYTSAAEMLKAVRPRIAEAYQRARAEGRTSNHRENVLMFTCVEKDLVHFNSTRVIKKSAVDGDEFSQAEIEARKQALELIGLLRAEVPAFENAVIYSIAPQIGVRESRRVTGRYLLTRADFERCAAFPDGIARVRYPIDIHSPSGAGTEIVHVPEGCWYEVPYRSLIPVGIENLAIGSRCISADHATHSSLRVMPPVVSIGQAAGTAAAMAIEGGIGLGSVDGSELVRRLIARGRSLVVHEARPGIVEVDARKVQ